MKNRFILACLIILCLVASSSTAHPGRTDSQGGHTNRSTGEYHFHHGYPEHQHTNGVCPYDYHDNTDRSGNSSKGNSSRNTKPKTEVSKPAVKEPIPVVERVEKEPSSPTTKEVLQKIFLGLLYLPGLALAGSFVVEILVSLWDSIKRLFKKTK